MSAVRHIEDAIFYTASNIKDPSEQEAFLEKACGGDEHLRQLVLGMLKAGAQADRFFAKNDPIPRVLDKLSPETVSGGKRDPTATRHPNSVDEQVGTRIGRYKLLQRIGEGGCGVVYMAEQEDPVRRRVALKIIKLGMDTRHVIARFEAERQALAMMDHPNIARVLDAGATETGRPFFVMELVRGVPLTTFCDQNKLDTRKRLELFIPVCQAIQHAHQKGIIHRDIKPTNILVTLHDGKPVPKVIDFGIAKATGGRLTESTLFTAFEQLIGTPSYMSPEQAELSGLDVDTRSDIYSLGVLLYELLTGKTPFDGKALVKSGLDELRRTLREQEPQRPSMMVTTLQGEELKLTAVSHQAEVPKLISLLRGDLDWIVMKAIEKDRSRRYETANALALDIQRYLADEPVSARPPSRLYALRRLVRRNKAIFAGAAAVATALVIGLGTSTWLFFQERAGRQEQFKLRKEAEEARANESRLRQEEQVRHLVTQARLLILNEQFAEADQIVSGLTSVPPALESEYVYRPLAWWHATRGEWKSAIERFATLLYVDRDGSLDTISGDIMNAAVPFIELKDWAGYEQFRQQAIARVAGITNPVAAERVVKSSLLIPADEKTTTKLAALGKVAEASLIGKDASKDEIYDSWRCVSLALLEYRQNNYSKSVAWCTRSLLASSYNAPRTATAQVIRAMARFQQGDVTEANADLRRCAEILEPKFKQKLVVGNTAEGFWHDWLFAYILYGEANRLITGKDLPHLAQSPE